MRYIMSPLAAILAVGMLWSGAQAAETWTSTGNMSTTRNDHTETLLSNGQVLIAGGLQNYGANPTSTADTYDPVTGTFTAANNSMQSPRQAFRAVLLGNGKVLMIGGDGGSGILATCDLYDPGTRMFTATGNLNTARKWHTATLLSDGKVLVAGGQGPGGTLSSCEIYDPVGGTWSYTTGPLSDLRREAQAVRLSGAYSTKVLIVGGYKSGYLGTSEIYDESSGTWSSTTGNLAGARASHVLVLLDNGKVLAAGGDNGSSLKTCELFDPAAGTWSSTGNLALSRQQHAAAVLSDGRVLVCGGATNSGPDSRSSTELFDSGTGTWSNAPSMGGMRYAHTATLLSDGRVLVSGGTAGSPNATNTAELFNPGLPDITSPLTATGVKGQSFSYQITASNSPASFGASGLPAGLSVDAAGLISGTPSAAGSSSVTISATNAQGTGSAVLSLDITIEAWVPTADMPAELWKEGFSGGLFGNFAVRLNDGRILVVGGRDAAGQLSNRCFIFTPAVDTSSAAGTWTEAASMSTARNDVPILINPGASEKVLMAGGFDGISSCELYDPVANTWSPATSMNQARHAFAASVLSNGKVLVTGGYTGGYKNQCEVYDPAANTWTSVASMNVARDVHTQTTLADGKVLVTGGHNPDAITSCELYDPVGNTWTVVDALAQPRQEHCAILLDDGRVLVAGGSPNYSSDHLTSQVFDPAAAPGSRWSAEINTNLAAHANAQLVKLTGATYGGYALLIGGGASVPATNRCEIFDPGTNTWSYTATLNGSRIGMFAAVIDDNRVLACGGYAGSTRLKTAEVLLLDGGTPTPTAPAITSALQKFGKKNNLFSYTLTATGTPTPTLSISEITPLIAGLSINGPQITGTPTAVGSCKAKLTASNANGTVEAVLKIYIGTRNSARVVDTTDDTITANYRSLRKALTEAPADDAIFFDEDVFGVHLPSAATVINILNGELPALDKGSVTIEAADRKVTINGSAAGTANGLVITSSNNLIKGLTLLRFTRDGIWLKPGAQNNILGGDRGAGTGPNGEGLRIADCGTNAIRITGPWPETTPATSDNKVHGCVLGLSVGGTLAAPNLSGVLVEKAAINNEIGGPASAGLQVFVSGNVYEGVTFVHAGTDDNSTANVSVGVGLDNQTGLGNGTSGIFLSQGTQGNKVGGTATLDACKVWSNGYYGIEVRTGDSKENDFARNSISLNDAGSIALFDGSNEGILAPVLNPPEDVGGASPASEGGSQPKAMATLQRKMVSGYLLAGQKDQWAQGSIPEQQPRVIVYNDPYGGLKPGAGYKRLPVKGTYYDTDGTVLEGDIPGGRDYLAIKPDGTFWGEFDLDPDMSVTGTVSGGQNASRRSTSPVGDVNFTPSVDSPPTANPNPITMGP